jgi:hypothetical protein
VPQPPPAPKPNPDEVRAPIESQHNKLRDGIETKYTQDRVNLRNQFHADLKSNADAKATALEGAGLNPDGSVPPDYYNGS